MAVSSSTKNPLCKDRFEVKVVSRNWSTCFWNTKIDLLWLNTYASFIRNIPVKFISVLVTGHVIRTDWPCSTSIPQFSAVVNSTVHWQAAMHGSFRLNAANRRCGQHNWFLVGTVTDYQQDVFTAGRAYSSCRHDRSSAQFNRCMRQWRPINRDSLCSSRAEFASFTRSSCPPAPSISYRTRRSDPPDAAWRHRDVTMTWWAHVVCGNIRGCVLCRGILPLSLWCRSSLNGSIIRNDMFAVNAHKTVVPLCTEATRQLAATDQTWMPAEQRYQKNSTNQYSYSHLKLRRCKFRQQ